jgi:regulator of protease activity HflC (stomatin/prohibitin superfamily)
MAEDAGGLTGSGEGGDTRVSCEGMRGEGCMEGIDVQAVVRQAIQEFVNNEQAKAEPAHKAELQEERRRREQLERRVNELVEENKRSRKDGGGGGTRIGGAGGTAASGCGEGGPGLQSGAGRHRAERGRAAGGAGREAARCRLASTWRRS